MSCALSAGLCCRPQQILRKANAASCRTNPLGRGRFLGDDVSCKRSECNPHRGGYNRLRRVRQVRVILMVGISTKRLGDANHV